MPSPKRKWYQFSLRTFLIFTTVVVCTVCWLSNQLIKAGVQREIVEKLRIGGIIVSYDYQVIEKEKDFKCIDKPVSRSFLESLFGIGFAADVVFITTSYGEKPTEATLSLLPRLPKIKFVSLFGRNVTDEAMKYLGQLPELKIANLDTVKISSKGLAELKHAKNLRKLMLEGSTIDDETLAGLASLNQLETVFIKCPKVTSAGFSQLTSSHELREVLIFNSSVLDDECLRYFGRLRNLKSFMCHHATFTATGLRHLSGEQVSSVGSSDNDESKAKGSTLRYLNLKSTNLTDDGIIEISRLNNLEVLNISNSKITDAGLFHLKSLTKLINLEVGPEITRDAAEALGAKLPSCHHIESINHQGKREIYYEKIHQN